MPLVGTVIPLISGALDIRGIPLGGGCCGESKVVNKKITPKEGHGMASTGFVDTVSQ